MGINFTYPLWLILIPLGLIYIFLTSKNLNRKGKTKKNVILFIRGIVIVLLVLAIAQTGITWNIKDISTIYLIDASDSIKDSFDTSEDFIKEAFGLMKDKDSAGVIIFGEDPVMESFLSKEPIFERISGGVEGKYTNIEKAITTGISVLPDKSKKRIVLITDGEENEGDSSKTAGVLKEQGIDLKVFKIDKDKGKELAVTNVTVPNSVNKGEEYNIIVNIKSNFDTNGRLVLFDGNERAAEEIITISKGENRFVFNDKSESTGFKIYKVVVEADQDKDSRNNEASAIINVLDEPRILLIEGASEEGEELSKMLNAFDVNYERLNAVSAPSSLQSLIQYKTVILANVSAEKLNSGFLSSLESYVKDFGGGLIAVGGDDSFALGGYYKTSLEKVLPVDMELKGKKAIPDMSIILVIDKSGSMSDGIGGISRIDLAKEAASRVLDSLRDQDSIGVLAFDNAMYWVVEPQKPGDREEIRNRIGSIRASGGTSILPPLKEAIKTSKGINKGIKHVILLTDGQAEKSGYDDVLADAEKLGITVSTVAVGHDADSNLLQYISQKANGRFYQTDEYSNLPTIFAKETFMAARAYLNNREFTPRIASFHPVISNVATKGLPNLLGYVAASPKDTARVLLESDEEDPILTLWQYGLGKTIAWNSDMAGKWSANYVNWENNLLLWSNIINWTIENYEDSELQVDTNLQGGFAFIDVKQINSSEEHDTKAIITSPSLKPLEINLDTEAPGQYRGSFKTDEIGSYLIKIVQSKGSEIKNTVGTGISIPYSPEYSIDAKSDRLDRLVLEGDGKYINSAKEVYEGNIADVSGRRDLTSILLLLAFIVFLIDIALRRLSLRFEKAAKRFKNVSNKVRIKRKEYKEKSKAKERASQDSYSEKTEDKKVAKDKEKEPKIVPEKKKNIKTLDTDTLLKRKRGK